MAWGEGQLIVFREQQPGVETVRQFGAVVDQCTVGLALQQGMCQTILLGHFQLYLESRDAPKNFPQRRGDDAG